MKRPCARPGCPNLVERGYCEGCRPRSQAAVAEQVRGSSAQRGYGYKWQQARAGYLKAHPLCVDPDKRHEGRARIATDLDHVIPHRGDQKLFWDRKNWQPLCHECHSYKTAREDGGFGRSGKWFEGTKLAWAAARSNTTVVCGLAATGKSTYVKQRLQPGDLYWDYDEAMAELSGLPMHVASPAFHDAVLDRRDRFVASTAQHAGHVWIIISDRSARLVRLLETAGAKVVELVVDEGLRVERLVQRIGG